MLIIYFRKIMYAYYSLHILSFSLILNFIKRKCIEVLIWVQGHKSIERRMNQNFKINLLYSCEGRSKVVIALRLVQPFHLLGDFFVPVFLGSIAAGYLAADFFRVWAAGFLFVTAFLAAGFFFGAAFFFAVFSTTASGATLNHPETPQVYHCASM